MMIDTLSGVLSGAEFGANCKGAGNLVTYLKSFDFNGFVYKQILFFCSCASKKGYYIILTFRELLIESHCLC